MCMTFGGGVCTSSRAGSGGSGMVVSGREPPKFRAKVGRVRAAAAAVWYLIDRSTIAFQLDILMT